MYMDGNFRSTHYQEKMREKSQKGISQKDKESTGSQTLPQETTWIFMTLIK